MNNRIGDLLFGGEMLKGEVGIEVEVEGSRIPAAIESNKGRARFWNTERDGSLRGESAEYVLREPITRKDVPVALANLFAAFKQHETTFIDSGRAGVHVHINVRDLNKDQVFAFVLLYLVFEQVLVRYCGRDREGNLFCLRATDAEYLMVLLRKAIIADSISGFRTDDIRYASINLSALSKYGSLEFRAMRSPVTEDVIGTWVDLLLRIKDAAILYTDPSEIVLGVSQAGGYEFARSVFGDLTDALPCEDWGRAVMSGMRLIQPLAIACRETLARRAEKEALRSEREKRLDAIRIPSPEVNQVATEIAIASNLPPWGPYYTLGA